MTKQKEEALYFKRSECIPATVCPVCPLMLLAHALFDVPGQKQHTVTKSRTYNIKISNQVATLGDKMTPVRAITSDLRVISKQVAIKSRSKLVEQWNPKVFSVFEFVFFVAHTARIFEAGSMLCNYQQLCSPNGGQHIMLSCPGEEKSIFSSWPFSAQRNSFNGACVRHQQRRINGSWALCVSGGSAIKVTGQLTDGDTPHWPLPRGGRATEGPRRCLESISPSTEGLKFCS